LSNKKENLAVFNLADFHNSPNRQNKFYAKFSSHTVYHIAQNFGGRKLWRIHPSKHFGGKNFGGW